MEKRTLIGLREKGEMRERIGSSGRGVVKKKERGEGRGRVGRGI